MVWEGGRGGGGGGEITWQNSKLSFDSSKAKIEHCMGKYVGSIHHFIGQVLRE